jgi:putative GTP pyrophosphokinase
MARSRKISELIEWFHREKPILENLARTAEGILHNLLRKHRIQTVSITSRVKGSESLVEKQRLKRYKTPISEITDFVGLRVITYTEDDSVRR